MHVKIKNWRCIKEIEFDLSKINLFLGQNATGKSSLAYALYFFSKASKIGVDKTIELLYNNITRIIRIENDAPCYPASVCIDDHCIELKSKHRYSDLGEDRLEALLRELEREEIEKMKKSPKWTEEYLLPSIRLACLQILRIIQKEVIGSGHKLAIEINEKIKELPLPNQGLVFLFDLDRAISKGKLSISSKMGYIMKVELLLPYLTLEIIDPYTDLKLSLEDAPDGQADQALIDLILDRTSKNSLIVIEEPEIYKNPVLQFELMKEISEIAINKNLTVVMTTHSEIIPLSIAKLVEVGKIKPEDVKIYYLTRSKEDPWTKIKNIKVYEDGTLEELPDSEKITTHLF